MLFAGIILPKQEPVILFLSGIWTILHTAYLKSLTNNTIIYTHLKEIVALAKKENIKIVLLKGLALEKTVYGNKGLRQLSDIDHLG